MFASVIRETPFYNNVANELFENKICGGLFGNLDCSLISTLRALLFNRIGENTLNVKYTFINYLPSISSLEALNNKVIGDTFNSTDNFYMLNIASFGDEINSFVDNFTKNNKGFVRLNKVTEFFRNKAGIYCFVNPTNRNVFILGEALDTKQFHYIQCGIPVYFPWYFDPKDRLSDDEMKLIESFQKTDCGAYSEAIHTLYHKTNLREKIIRANLKDFELASEKAELTNIEEKTKGYISQINSYKENIATLLKAKKDLEIRYMGLISMIEKKSTESGMMDYFVCNKSLHLTRVQDGRISFAVKGYLTFYDPEMAEQMIANKSSYIYRCQTNCANLIAPEDIEMLMRAIFVDSKLKMKFCAHYSITLGYQVKADKAYNYNPLPGFEDCTPNPHTDIFGCMGDYESIINDMILDGDYIGAVEQCVASCKSLNFGDSTVMKEFMRRIYGADNTGANMTCIELPDGTVVNPRKAIEYLRKETESNEQ